ncbi:Ubiquitin carboxyl-terminal hydrolase 14 [Yarrowia sp. E02]|nr:Ubiquitin carboxyl-terminal hydrolase 14 [Yarrowia sp. E02]
MTYEEVELSECLSDYTGAQTTDYSCKCGGKEASVSNKFASLPDVLVLNATRFQIKNWVPMKVDVNLNVSENLCLDDYMSSGKQDNEEELPEDEQEQGESAGWTANEAAVEILSAMGFPTVRCEKALYHTGNSDPDAAMNWLFAHMEDADIDEPLVIDASSSSGGSNDNSAAIAQVAEMGFTPNQARKALRECSGNVEMAVAWLFENPGDEGEDESAAVVADATPSGPVGHTEKPHKYELTGIICHKGTSVHAGHYVAYVKKDGEWVLFNDEKVVSSSVEDMKKLAYVYVFQRV